MSLKRNVNYVVLILCASIPIVAQTQAAGSNSKPEDQVAQVERDWITADGKGDIAALRQIIADDFVGSSFDGTILTKGDIIPQGTEPGGFAGASLGETNVRVFGDTGVIIGIINIASGTQKIRVALVCQKRSQGSWQIIAAEMTRMQ